MSNNKKNNYSNRLWRKSKTGKRKRFNHIAASDDLTLLLYNGGYTRDSFVRGCASYQDNGNNLFAADTGRFTAKIA